MTDSLSPAERAALAARGWYETQQRRGERLDPASMLLYRQLGEIYAEQVKAAPPADVVRPRLVKGYAPLASRTCGHGRLTYYNLAIPYCGHDDGTECDDLMGHAAADLEPVWVKTEMRHARVGDVIRPIGQDIEGRKVVDRYLPPDAKGGNAGHWHVVSGGPKHWDDRVVQPGEVWLCFEDTPATPLNLRLDFPIEIQMAQHEADAIALLGGWENRMDAR